MAEHLWEYDHPYYCGEATWYRRTDGGFDHERWSSWAEFRDNTLLVTGDRDLNLLVRWDWTSYRRHPDPHLRSDSPDELLLYFVMQRKPILCSHYVMVRDDDEPEVRAWLRECARAMRATWEPLLDDVIPVGKHPKEPGGWCRSCSIRHSEVEWARIRSQVAREARGD